MKYILVNSNKKDIEKLIQYKLNSILAYTKDLSDDEMLKINTYVEKNVTNHLADYQNIVVDDRMIGCVLVVTKDDGVLLDEIYIEEKYRNMKIGTNIIKNILNDNKIVYLWVYKLNNNAIKLYKKLGFSILEETDTRYYMKYDNLNHIRKFCSKIKKK